MNYPCVSKTNVLNYPCISKMAEIVCKSQSGVHELTQYAILDELKKYFFIGGMPECVKVYSDSRSLLDI